MEDFAQSSPNLTQASQCLFDLLESQAIQLYPDSAMRLACSRAVAIETPRGWRIGKDKSAFKIDVIVALAQACYAAIQGAIGGAEQTYLDCFTAAWAPEKIPEQPKSTASTNLNNLYGQFDARGRFWGY